MNWCEKLREDLGMSKEAFAEKVQVTGRTVYRWEREGQFPRAGQFALIELVAGKSIQEVCPEIFDPTR